MMFWRWDLDTAFVRDAGSSVNRSGDEEARKATSLADGEGSRCISFESGKQAFLAAVQADPSLSAAERAELTETRNQTVPACSGGVSHSSESHANLASLAAKDFNTYLQGAKAFYEGAFDEAKIRFRLLAKSENAWVQETARYMIGRTLLNKAQIGAFDSFDQTGEPRASDKASLGASETEIKAYLTAYPAGRYAISARGLLRRIYWLGADEARLSAEYGWQIAHLTASMDVDDLVEEIDSKYLRAAKDQSHEPILLAVQDLMRLRGSSRPKFSAADIEAQAPDFAGHEELFAFLKAARAYYVDGEPDVALRLLGPPQSGPSYLDFSREMLRGQAFLASGQYQAAIAHWRALLPNLAQPWQSEAVELGLALSWERAGTLNKVFLPETRVASSRIRQILLSHTAGPILLRMAVDDPKSTPDERNLARFVLLFKEATRGQYANFLRDLALIKNVEAGQAAAFLWRGASEPYQCPALKEVIGELLANNRDPHGLLCLGEFVRTAELDAFESFRPKPDELGGGESIFPGEPFSRGELYKRLIADPSTPDRERAYALYRAINCYAPTGANRCGGTDVELSQRKTWFNMLKSRYSATSWAQGLKYYW